jgi:hypothetical protein
VSYAVVLSMEAVEDVLRITMASSTKAAVINASKRLQAALADDPADAGEYLSEGLYFIDREPLRAFYTINPEELTVAIACVKPL